VETWQRILEQARKWGWQPQATLPPPISFDPQPEAAQGQPWRGDYLPAMGQTIRESDTRALAAALSEIPFEELATQQLQLADVRLVLNLCRGEGGLIISPVCPEGIADNAVARDLLAFGDAVGEQIPIEAPEPVKEHSRLQAGKPGLQPGPRRGHDENVVQFQRITGAEPRRHR